MWITSNSFSCSAYANTSCSLYTNEILTTAADPEAVVSAEYIVYSSTLKD